MKKSSGIIVLILQVTAKAKHKGINLSLNSYLFTAPSASPQLLTYTATPQSLEVSWTEPPCGSRGGDILDYRYQFMDLSEGNEIVNETKQKSIEFTGLVPCGSYEFSVSAKTFVGAGPESDVLPMETEAVGKSF